MVGGYALKVVGTIMAIAGACFLLGGCLAGVNKDPNSAWLFLVGAVLFFGGGFLKYTARQTVRVKGGGQ